MKYFCLLLCIFFSVSLFAQDEESAFNTDLGADLVSSYMWRGIQLDSGPNIQGWGELGFGNFAVGVWSSSNFIGTFTETDLYASYSMNNFTIMVTDYFTGNEAYFEFKKETTFHSGELTLQYYFGDNFPLQLSANIIFYGADLKLDSYNLFGDPVFTDKNNYSSYIELSYPIELESSSIGLVAGFVVNESYYYGTDGAAIINLGASISKEIKMNENFNLPLNFAVIVNPHYESVYTVFGISF